MQEYGRPKGFHTDEIPIGSYRRSRSTGKQYSPYPPISIYLIRASAPNMLSTCNNLSPGLSICLSNYDVANAGPARAENEE